LGCYFSAFPRHFSRRGEGDSDLISVEIGIPQFKFLAQLLIGWKGKMGELEGAFGWFKAEFYG
jgi:hypothetical protein